MLCNRICQWSRNDGLHSHRLLRHRSLLNATCTYVVQKKNSHFISADKLIRTIRAFHCNSYTVCIRVCRQHQICLCLFCKLQSQLQCLENLRVRITAGCEITIRILLLRNNRDICNADIFQYPGNRNKP